MKINIKDKEFELHYSMRMFIIYENIMGSGLDINNLSTYTAVITLLYAAISSSIQYYKLGIELSFDDYMNWLDEDPATRIQEFTNWFLNHMNEQSEKIDKIVEEKTSNKDNSEDKKSKN